MGLAVSNTKGHRLPTMDQAVRDYVLRLDPDVIIVKADPRHLDETNRWGNRTLVYSFVVRDPQASGLERWVYFAQRRKGGYHILRMGRKKLPDLERFALEVKENPPQLPRSKDKVSVEIGRRHLESKGVEVMAFDGLHERTNNSVTFRYVGIGVDGNPHRYKVRLVFWFDPPQVEFWSRIDPEPTELEALAWVEFSNKGFLRGKSDRKKAKRGKKVKENSSEEKGKLAEAEDSIRSRQGVPVKFEGLGQNRLGPGDAFEGSRSTFPALSYIVRLVDGSHRRWVVAEMIRERVIRERGEETWHVVSDEPIPELELMAILTKENPKLRSVPAVGHGMAAISSEGFSRIVFVKKAVGSRGPVLVFSGWREGKEYAIYVGRVTGDRLDVRWKEKGAGSQENPEAHRVWLEKRGIRVIEELAPAFWPGPMSTTSVVYWFAGRRSSGEVKRFGVLVAPGGKYRKPSWQLVEKPFTELEQLAWATRDISKDVKENPRKRKPEKPFLAIESLRRSRVNTWAQDPRGADVRFEAKQARRGTAAEEFWLAVSRRNYEHPGTSYKGLEAYWHFNPPKSARDRARLEWDRPDMSELRMLGLTAKENPDFDLAQIEALIRDRTIPWLKGIKGKDRTAGLLTGASWTVSTPKVTYHLFSVTSSPEQTDWRVLAVDQGEDKHTIWFKGATLAEKLERADEHALRVHGDLWALGQTYDSKENPMKQNSVRGQRVWGYWSQVARAVQIPGGQPAGGYGQINPSSQFSAGSKVRVSPSSSKWSDQGIELTVLAARGDRLDLVDAQGGQMALVRRDGLWYDSGQGLSLNVEPITATRNPKTEIYDPREEQVRAQRQGIYESLVRKELGLPSKTEFRTPDGKRLDTQLSAERRAALTSKTFAIGTRVPSRDKRLYSGTQTPTPKSIEESRQRYADVDHVIRNRQDYEETLALNRKSGFYRMTLEPVSWNTQAYFIWPMPPDVKGPLMVLSESRALKLVGELNQTKDPRKTGRWWVPPKFAWTEEELCHWLPGPGAFSGADTKLESKGQRNPRRSRSEHRRRTA